MIRGARYVIAVPDLERSARYYRDVLGFEVREVDDADRLHEELVTRGAQLIKPLRTEPWGMREFGIRTEDGHRIMFGCPVPSEG